MTRAIVKPDITRHFELKQYMVQLIQSTGLFEGLPQEDPQRHIQNFLEITDPYNYPNASKGYVRLILFPFSLIEEAKEWLNKEPANSIRTWDDLETWERYKKLLRDCPHHYQTDEVLGPTFADGLDDASKMNLDSACEAVKQKSAGLLELNEVSAMRANIAKLANQMTRMTMQQPQTMQHVQRMTICCELCGDSHMSVMCPTNQESIYYVGQQNRGPPNQHAQYGNYYNPNWRNHP
ncbi:uncharacterized protein [Nicotiana sylvestris]|uniref:uncharacterized protein n=1 Tax=Nicotiana sylvestris TaxID=4096 RepID=UPI00388C8B45